MQPADITELLAQNQLSSDIHLSIRQNNRIKADSDSLEELEKLQTQLGDLGCQIQEKVQKTFSSASGPSRFWFLILAMPETGD